MFLPPEHGSGGVWARRHAFYERWLQRGPTAGDFLLSQALCTKKYGRYVEREREKIKDCGDPLSSFVDFVDSATVNKSLGIAESGVLCAL